MQRQDLNPWNWQDALGYSQGVELRSIQQLVLCAGQASIDADGSPLHPGDMGAQVEESLDNIEAVLGKAGMSLRDVVRLDIYTTDLDQLWAAYPSLVARLQRAGTQPAGGILAEVSRLARPELLVEITATAAR
jgi:enamine deaminase RidA (YjgF/YER057c/UK114 family)